MSEFEAYAKNVTSGLDLPETVKTRIAEEVVAHLEDETRRCMSQNMPRPEAERAALERFGREQIIGQLVAQAMERKQARFRLLQNLRMAVAGLACVVISVAVGAWFQVFDDTFSSHRFVGSLPEMVEPTLYVGGLVGSLVFLAAVVASIFRARKSLAIVSSIIVLLVFWASGWVFDTMVAPRLLGDFQGRETEYIRLVDSFSRRLYLCLVPTLVTGTLIWILAGRRAYLSWLGLVLAAGLLSTLFACIDGLPYRSPWEYSTKWPKLLATGLLTLVFVMLAGFLARAIAERFGWDIEHPSPCAGLHAEDKSVETA